MWASRKGLHQFQLRLSWTVADYLYSLSDLHQRLRERIESDPIWPGHPVMAAQPPLLKGAPGIAVVQAKKVFP